MPFKGTWKIREYYTNDRIVFEKTWPKSQGPIYKGAQVLIHAVSHLDDLFQNEYDECPQFYDILREGLNWDDEIYHILFVYWPEED